MTPQFKTMYSHSILATKKNSPGHLLSLHHDLTVCALMFRLPASGIVTHPSESKMSGAEP